LGKVYFAVLLERTLLDHPVCSLMDISLRAGRLGFRRISVPYAKVEIARDKIVETFLAAAGAPDDVLVMLDCDHIHPEEVVERLASYGKPLVSALAFRRGEPFDPQIYRVGDEGRLVQPSSWDVDPADPLLEVDATGFAAVAIRRDTFDRLKEAGYKAPWFRFEWHEDHGAWLGEDIRFSLMCRDAGLPIYCDLGLISPHVTLATVDADSWGQWLADHPGWPTQPERAEDEAERGQ
jgi:hypothetical protein